MQLEVESSLETNIVTENGEKERERVGDRDPPSDHCSPHFLFLSSQKQSSLFEDGISIIHGNNLKMEYPWQQFEDGISMATI